MEQSSGIDTQAIIEALAGLVTQYGLRVVGAIVVLVVGWLVAKTVRGWTRRLLTRSNTDATLVPFVSNLVYYLLLTFVVVAVLGLFGIPTTSFIAVLGAAGLAVGLALQGTLSNFAAGVMLLVFRPFKVDDFIEAGGATGKVIEIGIFSTTLHTPDNVRIVIPNSGVYGGMVKNFSANDTRRNDLVVGISYDDDIGKAIDTIRGVIDADSRVLPEPAPQIAVSEMADSSVNLVVRPWCRAEDYWPMRFDLTRALKEQLEAAGCSIPYPQTDVHVHSTKA
jgi:small conductance mechanosensitive channel